MGSLGHLNADDLEALKEANFDLSKVHWPDIAIDVGNQYEDLRKENKRLKRRIRELEKKLIHAG